MGVSEDEPMYCFLRGPLGLGFSGNSLLYPHGTTYTPERPRELSAKILCRSNSSNDHHSNNSSHHSSKISSNASIITVIICLKLPKFGQYASTHQGTRSPPSGGFLKL